MLNDEYIGKSVSMVATKVSDEPEELSTIRKEQRVRNGGGVARRFGLLNAFIDHAMPILSRSQVTAWLLLYRHAKPDGTVPASVADLAKRCGTGERTMRYALEKLQAFRLIRRIKRGTLAGGPSIWQLSVPIVNLDRQRNAG